MGLPGAEKGEEYREIVDESQQDISGLPPILVILPAENGACNKVITLLEASTNRKSQRRFLDPSKP